MTDDSRIHALKRPAIERMLRIHHEVKAKHYPNCTTLAREFEVSAKTISRDIEFMRDRMLLPLEYEHVKHGFYYTREVESLPSIDISEGELLALSIARKALDHYKGTPFEKPLKNALNKIAASLPDTITANLTALSESISFRQSGLSSVDEPLLLQFTKATLEKRAIAFSYRKLGSEKLETRSLKPYHLTNYLGRWYVIGLDAQRAAIRTFLLSRASEPRLSQNTFEVPETFSAEDYLGSSFGIYSPSGEHHVSIRFKSRIAEYVAENTWHPSQTAEYAPDGSLTLSFELGSLVEVASWILSWGDGAEALQPPELRQTIRETARKVALLYQH